MAKKKSYYDITNLLSTGADYMMLLGQRANGKSYQVKMTVLTEAYENDLKFVYLRRWKADIKQNSVSAYFDDMPVTKITHGDWANIIARQGAIYFTRVNSDGDEERKEIGRYCALNEKERYKSQVFKGYGSIVYEEFITDELYLDDEPTSLQQFISTVARLDKVKVFLIGNTLTRVCPYFHEWCLEGVLTQKQGTIDMYHYHVESGQEIHIAVEYCANTNNENVMFFGQASKQIVSGVWDVKEYPKLLRKQYEYDMVYEVKVIYQAFSFIVQLMVEPKNGGKFLFVYPLTKKRDVYRVIQDEFSDLPNVTCKLDISKKPEQMIIDCLRLNKICYSDNLTGSDFSKCIEYLKIG